MSPLELIADYKSTSIAILTNVTGAFKETCYKEVRDPINCLNKLVIKSVHRSSGASFLIYDILYCSWVSQSHQENSFFSFYNCL